MRINCTREHIHTYLISCCASPTLVVRETAKHAYISLHMYVDYCLVGNFWLVSTRPIAHSGGCVCIRNCVDEMAWTLGSPW